MHKVTAGEWTALIMAAVSAALAAFMLPAGPHQKKWRIGVAITIVLVLAIGIGSFLTGAGPQVLLTSCAATVLFSTLIILWPTFAFWVRLLATVAVIAASAFGAVTILQSIGSSDTVDSGLARTEGVLLTLGTAIPRCNARFEGTAPRVDRNEVWVAHRDRDDEDKSYYYNKASWLGESEKWELVTNIGSEDDKDHTFEFIAFTLDGQSSSFLYNLAVIGGAPGGKGVPLFSKDLPHGLLPEQLEQTATRLDQPICPP
jgi:hypothetical protein